MAFDIGPLLILHQYLGSTTMLPRHQCKVIFILQFFMRYNVNLGEGINKVQIYKLAATFSWSNIFFDIEI